MADEMTSDRVSNERMAVADALEEFALIDECEGGNPLVIATERRAAQLLRSPVTVSDEMVLSGCLIMYPALFRRGLTPFPGDGPATRRTIDETIKTVTSILTVDLAGSNGE